MRRATVVASMVALAGAAWASPASGGAQAGSATIRTCSPFTTTYHAYIYHYPVKILRGKVTCKTARSVLKAYYVTGRAARGWTCKNAAYPYVRYLTRCT